MTTFNVTLTEYITYTVCVDAEDAETAAQRAEEAFLESDDPYADFKGSVEERTCAVARADNSAEQR